MRRREFIALVGGSAAWPLTGRAQQKTIPLVGFLSSASPEPFARYAAAFRRGLSDAGYAEGKDISVEFRWAEGDYQRLPSLVAELVRLKVNVIVTHGTPATRAAKQVTNTTPIVMAISGDAVATGLIESLARPGVNITGSTFFLPQLNAKRLELLQEAIPRVTKIAALSNPANPVSQPILPAMQTGAALLKVRVEPFKAQRPNDFESAFAAMGERHMEAVVVTEDGEFAASFRVIAALALGKRLPSIGATDFAQAGGLIGYGPHLLELYQRAANFVDRILKGAKPSDLPIEQPTKFELVINLKTAKALGLNIPPTLLARADEVIE